MKCTKCKEDKNNDDFAFKYKEKGILQKHCKKCNKEDVTKNYLNNKQRYSENTKKNRQNKRDWFKQYKSQLRCIKCGESHYSCLDFHHIDPNIKEGTIGYLIERGWALNRIKIEIEKCIIFCSNCHRKFHYLEKTDNITLEQYIKRACG